MRLERVLEQGIHPSLEVQGIYLGFRIYLGGSGKCRSQQIPGETALGNEPSRKRKKGTVL